MLHRVRWNANNEFDPDRLIVLHLAAVPHMSQILLFIIAVAQRLFRWNAVRDCSERGEASRTDAIVDDALPADVHATRGRHPRQVALLHATSYAKLVDYSATNFDWNQAGAFGRNSAAGSEETGKVGRRLHPTIAAYHVYRHDTLLHPLKIWLGGAATKMGFTPDHSPCAIT